MPRHAAQQLDCECVQSQAHGGLAAPGGKDRAGRRDVEAPEDRQSGVASGAKNHRAGRDWIGRSIA
jgi:hypothetical protein